MQKIEAFSQKVSDEKLEKDMENYVNLAKELGLTFSQRQHHFTRMLMRLIQGEFQPAKSK